MTPGSDNAEAVPAERDDVLAILEETMAEVQACINPSEATTPEEQELQIKWVRTLGYLAGQYRMLKRDTDLDEMEDELELIEMARDAQEGR